MEEQNNKYKVTIHCGARYTERIMGKEQKYSKAFYQANKEQVDEYLNKTMEYATCIYDGQMGNFPHRRFFLKDDYIICVGKEDVLISIWKIGFGLISEASTKLIAHTFFEEIEMLQNKRGDKYNNINALIDDNDKEKELIDKEIEGLSLKITILKEKRNQMNTTEKIAQRDIEVIDNNIEKILITIIGKGVGREIQ